MDNGGVGVGGAGNSQARVDEVEGGVGEVAHKVEKVVDGLTGGVGHVLGELLKVLLSRTELRKGVLVGSKGGSRNVGEGHFFFRE